MSAPQDAKEYSYEHWAELLKEIVITDRTQLSEIAAKNEVDEATFLILSDKILNNLERAIRHDRAKSIFRGLELSGLVVFSIAAVAALIICALLLIAGFIVLAVGIGEALKGVLDHHTLEYCVGGIEMLILSPLPYFVSRALAAYMYDYREFGRVRSNTRMELLETKTLIFGLLFSAVATHVAGLLFLPNKEISGTALYGTLIAFVIFGLLFFAMELLLIKHSKLHGGLPSPHRNSH